MAFDGKAKCLFTECSITGSLHLGMTIAWDEAEYSIAENAVAGSPANRYDSGEE